MDSHIPGLHHVTMIARDAQQNLDFYVRLLGLRLVKQTINFDDPGMYHFYYADNRGTPGTILTFFPIPLAHTGKLGVGQISSVALAIPPESMDWWEIRLATHEIRHERRSERFGETYLRFYDPDGLALELVSAPEIPGYAAWEESPVPAEHALRGVYSVTLLEQDPAATVELLTQTMGWRFAAQEGSRTRYVADEETSGRIVEIDHAPQGRQGVVSAGSVHHIAFRTADDAEQSAWQTRLTNAGYTVTEVKDRHYFHSIYFREPGGVLFEIATDPPGFTVDESIETLGTALKLPTPLEARRDQIVRRLPPTRLDR